MSASRTAQPAGTATPLSGGLELVHFRVGRYRIAVPRDQVRAIRPSPRVQGRLPGAAGELPLVSLSLVLGLDRDTSTDRRVLEVEHWGRRLGLEVTAIDGIRVVRERELHALPAILQRNLESAHVLGLVVPSPAGDVERRKDSLTEASGPTGADEPLLALDLTALLVEKGVEVADDEPTS